MQTPITWFDDVPIGDMPPAEVAALLYDLGDEELATQITQELQVDEHTFGLPSRWRPWSLTRQLWAHATNTFGYIEPAQPPQISLPIHSLNTIQGDATLKGSRLKITLDRLRVASYPGKGIHRILVHFYAQNQLPGTTEELHFNATYRVPEGEHAGVQGHPIFVGLNVGDEGIFFRCRTINVAGEDDDTFLHFLESDAFVTGLKLATVAQPAIGPLSSIALGITKQVISRHMNVAVQEIDLGLDFSHISTRPLLREGSYVAAQVPEDQDVFFQWSEWIYQNGLIVRKDAPQQKLPYNYLIFGISRYEETPPAK